MAGVTHAIGADFAAGKAAFDKGDYAKAAREWQIAAGDGDAASQFWWGLLLEQGRGVDKDGAAGRRWQVMSAERGYEYAQNALGWPIREETRPFLTCTPNTPSSAGGDNRVQVDSIKGFQFRVTLHNWRPPVEVPVIATFNLPEHRTDANIQIQVYSIENDQRREVGNQISAWGSGGEGREGAIMDRWEIATVRIPVEESERRAYLEQFLARLSQQPGQTAAQVQQIRELALHADRPDGVSYLDALMPNRVGKYEIVCRYQAQGIGFWPEPLIAPPLRFEYVRTTNWIETLDRKQPAK